MRTRLVGLVVLVTVFATVAGTTAPTAGALGYTGLPSTVIANPANWGGTYNLATGVTTFTPTASEGAVVARAMTASGLLTTAGLAAGALGAGVLIGSGIDRWFHISCRISSTCAPGDLLGSHNATFYDVRYYSGSGTLTGVGVGVPTGAAAGYYVGFNANQISWVDWICCSVSNGIFGWPDADTIGVYSGQALSQDLEDAADNWIAEAGTGTKVIYSDYMGVRVTQAEMEDLIEVDTAPVPYTSQPVGVNVTIPTDPGTGSSEATAIRAALLSGDDETDVAIAMLVDPDYEGLDSATFEMPDCEGLTAAACLALLEAEGWVGSSSSNDLGIDDAVLALGGGLVTTTNPAAGVGAIAPDADIELNLNPDPMPLELVAQLANETGSAYLTRIGFEGDVTYVTLPVETSDPARGPDSPVRVQAPAPAGGTRSIAVPLPGLDPPAQRVPNDPGTEITVYLNSPDMPPVDGGGGGCEPWMSAEPDFTPITGLELGDKFPFGIFVWADELLDAFTTSAVAPGWDHPMPSAGTHPVADYSWDLSFFDDYMNIWRQLLSFCLWIGAIWYIGTSLLGVRGAGDPGEAIDDVI